MKGDETVFSSHLPTYYGKYLSPDEVIIPQLVTEKDCGEKLVIKFVSIDDNIMLV